MMRAPFALSLIMRAIRELQTMDVARRRQFDAWMMASALPEFDPLGGLIVRQAMNPANLAK